MLFVQSTPYRVHTLSLKINFELRYSKHFVHHDIHGHDHEHGNLFHVYVFDYLTIYSISPASTATARTDDCIRVDRSWSALLSLSSPFTVKQDSILDFATSNQESIIGSNNTISCDTVLLIFYLPPDTSRDPCLRGRFQAVTFLHPLTQP